MFIDNINLSIEVLSRVPLKYVLTNGDDYIHQIVFKRKFSVFEDSIVSFARVMKGLRLGENTENGKIVVESMYGKMIGSEMRRQELTRATPDQSVDDEAVYLKAAGECPKGRVYGLGSLGRKKRRYADPGASTSRMRIWCRVRVQCRCEQLRKVMEFMHQHLGMNMDGAGLSQQQPPPPPPPPPPHDQQQLPQIDPVDPPQQGDNVERETQAWLTRDEQLGDT
ncbi:hypothetical protein Scep_016519 [Stephania cephalantha]|uniref:Uncharacterized protein n=1 Tax=Stephania cephalantha TaxID=152367 RepID=A0AAP0IPK5_9MAGN